MLFAKSYTYIGLLLIFLLSPLYLIRFSVVGVPTTFLEVLIYIVFVVFLVESFWLPRKFVEVPVVQRNRKKYFYPVFLILLGAGIGILRSDNIAGSVGIFKGFFFDSALVFYLLLRVCKKWKDYFHLFILAGVSGVGLLLYGLFTSSWTYDGRLASAFESANFLAMVVAPLCAYFLMWFIHFVWNFRKDKSFLYKLANLFILAFVLGTTLVLTKSYGGMFGVGVGVLAGLIFIRKQEIRKFWMTLGAGVVLLILVFGSQTGSGKLAQTFDLSSRTSSSVRLEVWEIGFKLALDNVISGIGPGQFEYEYGKNAYSLLGGKNPMEWNHPQPHNIFLAFWLNAGLLGLIGFIWLLRNFYIQTKKLKKEFFVWPIVAFMITVLIHGLVDTPFFKNDLAILFFLPVAAVFVSVGKK